MNVCTPTTLSYNPSFGAQKLCDLAEGGPISSDAHWATRYPCLMAAVSFKDHRFQVARKQETVTIRRSAAGLAMMEMVVVLCGITP